MILRIRSVFFLFFFFVLFFYLVAFPQSLHTSSPESEDTEIRHFFCCVARSLFGFWPVNARLLIMCATAFYAVIEFFE